MVTYSHQNSDIKKDVLAFTELMTADAVCSNESAWISMCHEHNFV